MNPLDTDTTTKAVRSRRPAVQPTNKRRLSTDITRGANDNPPEIPGGGAAAPRGSGGQHRPRYRDACGSVQDIKGFEAVRTLVRASRRLRSG
jgi:hypothetical protein